MPRVALLKSGQARDVLDLLHDDVDTNLYLLGALQSWGLANQDGVTWWGTFQGGRLRTVVWLGRPQPDPGNTVAAGLAVPWGDPDGALAIGEAIAAHGPPGMVIGPRAASDALWQGLGSPVPRLWYDQRLYVCTQVAPGPELLVRAARPEELELAAELSAAMMTEDLGQDPREEGADSWLRRVRGRVLAGRVQLGFDQGRVVFKVDVGSRFGPGVQVGGTYVPLGERGHGFGAAGMRATCRQLQRRTPRISLHVNEANLAAVRTYEAAGFQAAAAFRLAST